MAFKTAKELFKDRAQQTKKGSMWTDKTTGKTGCNSDFQRGVASGMNKQIVETMKAKKKVEEFKKANPNYKRTTK